MEWIEFTRKLKCCTIPLVLRSNPPKNVHCIKKTPQSAVYKWYNDTHGYTDCYSQYADPDDVNKHIDDEFI